MKEAESKSMLSALESILSHYAVEDSREEKKKLIVACYIFIENIKILTRLLIWDRYKSVL